MDTKTLLDELLKAGREIAQKGQDFAEEKLNLPEEGEKRDATLSGMKTGAIAAGALALLLGTGTGRRVTGSALKLGSLAAIGGVAWKAYQNYANKNQIETKEAVEPIDQIEDEKEADQRSITLLKAMIAAAKADGHVNDAELAEIDKQIENLGLSGDTAQIIQDELAKPLDIAEIAALADGKEEKAAEIYLVSAVVTDKENEMESRYLADLAKAMEIPAELLAELEAFAADEKDKA